MNIPIKCPHCNKVVAMARPGAACDGIEFKCPVCAKLFVPKWIDDKKNDKFINSRSD